MTRLLLRDDDLSFFTDPEELEAAYKGIWGRLPVSFAAIPFAATPAAGSAGKAPAKRGGKGRPLGENRRLVSALRRRIRKGEATIILHGHTHADRERGFEYEAGGVERLTREIAEGKAYLEGLFGIRIRCFVAPHDRFSRAAVIAAERNGLHLCRGYAPLPRELRLRPRTLLAFLRLALHYLGKDRRARYPAILDFGGHKEIYSHRIEDLDEERIRELLDESPPLLTVTSHYYALDREKRALLRLLADQARHGLIEPGELNSVWEEE